VFQAARGLWQLSGIPNQNPESLWGCVCPPPRTGFRPALSLMMTLYNRSLIKSKPGDAYEPPGFRRLIVLHLRRMREIYAQRLWFFWKKRTRSSPAYWKSQTSKLDYRLLDGSVPGSTLNRRPLPQRGAMWM
jgi:hypothetical protein